MLVAAAAAAGGAAATGLGCLLAGRSVAVSELEHERSRRNDLGLQLMCMRNKAMHSEKSVEVGLAMKPRPTDVFVSTYPKCGTTWMTQILHMLRTGGNMDFGATRV